MSPRHPRCIMPNLVNIGPALQIFYILWMYFRYFVIISPWKRTGPFNWTNVNSVHSRILCAKFGWNRSWRRRFLISSMYFCHFLIISLWKRAGPFLWTNFNPLYPMMLVQKTLNRQCFNAYLNYFIIIIDLTFPGKNHNVRFLIWINLYHVFHHVIWYVCVFL